jgi:hypothetical protein
MARQPHEAALALNCLNTSYYYFRIGSRRASRLLISQPFFSQGATPFRLDAEWSVRLGSGVPSQGAGGDLRRKSEPLTTFKQRGQCRRARRLEERPARGAA